MNWDAVGAIAEALGALGVLATLIYLAIQVRHNSVLIAQQQAGEAAANNRDTFSMLQDDFVRESAYRAFHTEEPLTEQQSMAAEGFFLGALVGFGLQWRAYRAGQLSESEWNVWRVQIANWFSTSWPRAWWEIGRGMFEDEGFAEEVDRIVAEAPMYGSHLTLVLQRAAEIRAGAATEQPADDGI